MRITLDTANPFDAEFVRRLVWPGQSQPATVAAAPVPAAPVAVEEVEDEVYDYEAGREILRSLVEQVGSPALPELLAANLTAAGTRNLSAYVRSCGSLTQAALAVVRPRGDSTTVEQDVLDQSTAVSAANTIRTVAGILGFDSDKWSSYVTK